MLGVGWQPGIWYNRWELWTIQSKYLDGGAGQRRFSDSWEPVQQACRKWIPPLPALLLLAKGDVRNKLTINNFRSRMESLTRVDMAAGLEVKTIVCKGQDLLMSKIPINLIESRTTFDSLTVSSRLLYIFLNSRGRHVTFYLDFALVMSSTLLCCVTQLSKRRIPGWKMTNRNVRDFYYSFFVVVAFILFFCPPEFSW